MQLDAIDEVDEFADQQDDTLNLTVTYKPAIIKHKEIVDVSQAEKDVEIAREEWDQLGPPSERNSTVVAQTSVIFCNEVLNYFRRRNMEQYLKGIQPVRHRKGLDAFKHWFAGPPKLREDLIYDRNLFFAIALCPFDSTEDVHNRVLQTLYKFIIGTEKDCPRYGAHWEELGFQGIDPGTDLRGVGFLGLLHLLYLAVNPAVTNLAREIYLLSRTERQNFPFCTMGINFSRIVMEAMREEVLNRECNRKMDIFKVTNDFYVGIFLRFFLIWRDQNKTIMDSGYVIKGLTAYAKKHSSVILKELYTYLNEK
ncbi:hypothetical protein JTE90_007991 [Oedothorax gibbosus]|uniref:ELMO domain-containing protein n=1 Tax=Oedothorax gibbosus TaxID=931172 RepID=A0AAV6UX88_9ARAC|nr:hypothetical protein JTE90_007991 [Oedothorax gibbosus]KAG8188419.1 hypothetical protein JTE90_007991 [Oedothorax gibbosus]